MVKLTIVLSIVTVILLIKYYVVKTPPANISRESLTVTGVIKEYLECEEFMIAFRIQEFTTPVSIISTLEHIGPLKIYGDPVEVGDQIAVEVLSIHGEEQRTLM